MKIITKENVIEYLIENGLDLNKPAFELTDEQLDFLNLLCEDCSARVNINESCNWNSRILDVIEMFKQINEIKK